MDLPLRAVALLWPFAKGSNLANYYTENMKAQLNLAPSQTQYICFDDFDLRAFVIHERLFRS